MSFFTDKSQGSDRGDFHLFVTDHPYMIDLGLGTFTTGTLFDWWNERNGAGLYVNRAAFSSSVSKTDLENLDPEPILGITTNTNFSWYGWKPSDEYQNAGVYEKQDLSGMGYGLENKPWSYESQVGTVYIHDVNWQHIDNVDKPIVGGTLHENGEFVRVIGRLPITGNGNETDTFKMIRPVYQIIQVNRLMGSFTDFYPRSIWDEGEPTIGGVPTKRLFASHELVTEMKSSKGGPYIEWSGEMTFHINENGGTLVCPITEWVKFKLYLYDNAINSSQGRVTTVKNLVYVAPPKDVTGRTFNVSEDGSYTNFNGNPTDQAASEIDVSVNPLNGKWESGSPSMLAVLTTDIGAATNPDIGVLETSDTKTVLDSKNFATEHFLAKTGTAMPIRPQNRNPLQWQPNYLEPESVRCQTGSAAKQTLLVYNRNPKRRYLRGETVLLQRVDGQWLVIDMGVDKDDTPTEPTGLPLGKWGEFTYLMTNADSFFRRSNADVGFDPREAELSFHSDYYVNREDSANTGVNYASSGGYHPTQPFDTRFISNSPTRMTHGFAQTTSFDSLDSKIFGIRSKPSLAGIEYEDRCSISSTIATLTNAGKTIPPPNPDYPNRNAAFTQTFFGCVFPEGYLGVTDYLTDANRGWEVKPASTEVTDPTEYLYHKENNATDNPFKSEASRNNCRLPSSTPIDTNITSDTSNWVRHNSLPDSDLFFLESKGDTKFASVPADVMLNASEAGKNGSPIRPVHRFKRFHAPLINLPQGSYLSDFAAQAFLHAAWLAKDVPGDEFDKQNSAFDFEPVNPYRLMFRPLKLEGYAQFALREANSEKVTRLLKSEHSEDIKVFSAEAHRTQLDNNRPITAYFEDRELEHADTGFHDDAVGLRWGGQVNKRRNYSYLHDNDYWNSNVSMNWISQIADGDYSKWRGANAFGVITTFNTITAGNKVTFTTNNQYGMGSDDSSVVVGQQSHDKSWGVGNFIESYQQENILDLSVRIYHAHPRNQTLYDPRTFAVHHFNPDVKYAFDEELKDDGTFDPLEPRRNFDTEFFDGTYSNANGDPLSFYYNAPLPSSTVDFREPSRFVKHLDPLTEDTHAENTVEDAYDSVIVPPNTYVFSDVTLDTDGEKPGLTPQNLWYVNTSRVGKLLPFRYVKKMLKVPVDKGVEIPITVNNGDLNALAKNLATTLIVKNRGARYKKNDTVGNSSLGYSFTVEEVEDGAITKLKCVENGTNISPNNTINSTTVINSASTGPLKLGNLTVQDGGNGFDAYYVAPMVLEDYLVDPKPTLMLRNGSDIVSISADTPSPTIPNAPNTRTAEEASFVQSIREVSWQFDPQYRSSTDQYDVFFHFHNDITMTWLACGYPFHGNPYNPAECHEQFIMVDISPE